MSLIKYYSLSHFNINKGGRGGGGGNEYSDLKAPYPLLLYVHKAKC